MPQPLDRRRFLLGATATAAAASGCSAIQPVERREIRHWDAEVDLIVAGSGAAGISAAIEARKAGLDVLVLEKLHLPGGSSSLSGGVCYLGGGTPLQKALGFDDSVEDMYRYMEAASGLYAQRDKLQLYCENSLEQFQWLVDLGVPYQNTFSAEKELPMTGASLYYSGNERARPYSDIARPAPRGHVPAEPGQTGGRRLMETLIPAAERLGAQLRTQVACEHLIRETDGRVSGLVVRDNGQRRHLRARRGVVLACGGFIHNREMVQRYAPELYPCSAPWGRAGDQGEGIRMGMGAGGAVAQMHHGFAILPLYPPEHVLKGIVVNAAGQRFTAEDVYYAFMGHQIAYHQAGEAYLITDADSDYGYKDYRVNLLAEAPSISQLERALSLPDGSLQLNVAYYNRHARKGQDPQFGKARNYLAPLAKPPYRAYDLRPDKSFYAAHTFGGLQTNTHAQVLDAWGAPIPGLYAAGRTSAGMPVAPYIGSGVSIGDCTFFGRQAGIHAAHTKA